MMLACAITGALICIAAADDRPAPEQPAETRAASTREQPTAEPLTLVGRGKDLAVMENGELEPLESAPPILILPEARSRESNRGETASPPAESINREQSRARLSGDEAEIEAALENRRKRLGRKERVTPPPARGNAAARSSKPRAKSGTPYYNTSDKSR